MSLKPVIAALEMKAENVREAIRCINIEASELSGVAAVIPPDAPPPARYFKGHKVILHNVSYSRSTSQIKATFALPYTNPDEEGKREHSGVKTRCAINENWFN